MITTALVDRFLGTASTEAAAEGQRYLGEGRVGHLVGSGESALTVVRGQTGDYDVALWDNGDELAHRCSCPSWRDPCKHEVAAALALNRFLTRRSHDLKTDRRSAFKNTHRQSALPVAVPDTTPADPVTARARALAERRQAAEREKLPVELDSPPHLRVSSPSGFVYRLTLRGDAQGPHSCQCPDFEANRLHTCKHVERVRQLLGRGELVLPDEHRRAAAAPRVYLHSGELVEPRLHGRPTGPGSDDVLGAFTGDGLALKPLHRDERELRAWLGRLRAWVEPEALDWLDRRLARRPELPDGPLGALVGPLPLELYPYQWQGAAFLARTGRALLADEMGLGKTVQALVAAVALRKASRPARRVTVVCPASVRATWKDEIARWLGEEALLLDGGVAERGRRIAAGHPWLVTHYEQVLRDFPEHRDHPPDLLVVDEAQRARGLATRTARVLKAIDARYVFALTGTPLENRLEDAYAIAQLIDQRLLPPLWQIDRDHFVRDGSAGRVVFYRDLDSMRSRLAPAFLRRRKEDVARDLPERLRSLLWVPMHPAARAQHDEVLAQVARLASRQPWTAAERERLQRLLTIARRACDGPHPLGPEHPAAAVPKLAELAELLADQCLGAGRKAVLFSEWTETTERVEQLCRDLGLPVTHLHGKVPVRRRPALVEAFVAAQAPAALVATDAFGLGLNLQGAELVVSLDLPWSPARLEQRIARVHRLGTERPVHVALLLCRDSIEERILALHATKDRLLDGIFGDERSDLLRAAGASGQLPDLVRELVAPAAKAAVDADAEAAAVRRVAAAVAPALPASTRAALATVLRALADALDGATPEEP